MESTVSVTYEYAPREQTHDCSPGEYNFYVYGAQGGQAYLGGNVSAIGGLGAYVYGKIHVSEPTTFTLIVGGKGNSAVNGEASGGYPNGGKAGKDNGIFEQNDDGSGAGGGSSTVKIGITNLIIAGAGSGGAGEAKGAPGGEINYLYCTDGANNVFKKINPTTDGHGNSNGYGSDGKNSASIPGSGGGGGHYGGANSNGTAVSNHYKSVACSGSSYINSQYFKNYSSMRGIRSGNGQIEITTVYQCPQECADCSSSTNCTKCYEGYQLLGSSCVITCPSHYFNLNNECVECDDSCAECHGDINSCTACSSDKFLYNHRCFDKCPDNAYTSEGQCFDCDSSCKTCDSASTCTSCHNGYILENGKCLSRTPEHVPVWHNNCQDWFFI